MSFHPARLATEKQSHRLPAVRGFAVHERVIMEENQIGETPESTASKALDLGPAETVFLFPSDRGLDFVFNFPDKRSVRIALDWGRVVDLDNRFTKFMNDAALMLTMGMNPYNSEHRESFVLAQLQGSSDA